MRLALSLIPGLFILGCLIAWFIRPKPQSDESCMSGWDRDDELDAEREYLAEQGRG